MIKVLADCCLEFDRGEKDGKGQLIVERTFIGFCELPDWVGKNDYFKMAVTAGKIKPFKAAAESGAVQKEAEKLAALKAQVAELEERKKQLKKETEGENAGGGSNGAPETPDPAK